MNKIKLTAVLLPVLLLGGCCAAFALSHSPQTERIRNLLNGSRKAEPTPTERIWLDMDGDGAITGKDYLRAKLRAVLHPGDDTHYVSPSAAKQLGRTAYHAETDTVWCSLSGSGIAFTAYGKSCVLHLTADSGWQGGDSTAARYAVYADGLLLHDLLLDEPEQTAAVPLNTNGTAIRLVKLSESQQSAVGIRSVEIHAESGKTNGSEPVPLLLAEPPREHCIEFIGDSITCGYGVDGVYQADRFQTANENATKSYAWLTAEQLGVDVSLVSYSGYGVLSGHTSPGRRNSVQLLPRVYELVGDSAAKLEGGRTIRDDKWDFAVQPDLIVINLGTNDASYTGADAGLKLDFSAAYTDFLRQVRAHNPDAPILCTLGIMGQTLCTAVEQAVLDYRAQTGDSNVHTRMFEMQSAADGFAVDWHPSAATHAKAAAGLAELIRSWLHW